MYRVFSEGCSLMYGYAELGEETEAKWRHCNSYSHDLYHGWLALCGLAYTTLASPHLPDGKY